MILRIVQNDVLRKVRHIGKGTGRPQVGPWDPKMSKWDPGPKPPKAGPGKPKVGLPIFITCS